MDGGRKDEPDDPVVVIMRGCEAGLPFPAIDDRLRQRFPTLTIEERAAAFREAARRQLAEADALERLVAEQERDR